VATLVDSHCHLNFEPLRDRIDQVLGNARDSGVDYLLCVGVTLEAFPEVRALAHAHPNVFASVGVHPNERDGEEPGVEQLVALATDPRVVAIGETGLDYYRSEGDLAWQHERFRRHIRAARQVRKPLIIHTREAAEDTLRIMHEEDAGEAGGVMHCFTESWEVASAALDLGLYVSFSGIVTFKSAEALREVARRVPAERLLVETDAPYLAPVPHRGKTNEPAYVRHVAECLAAVRGVAPEQIADTTTANFFSLFRAAHPA
jgi:TatD DNase family protein